MYQATTQVRVRYGETDKMGYAYYGNYMLYYEVGRTDALRELGLTYRQLEEDGIMLPVLELNSKYLKPVYYDDVLTVVTQINTLPGVRIKFDYSIYNEAKEIVNKGNTTLVFISEKDKRPCPPPKYFLDKIRGFFATT